MVDPSRSLCEYKQLAATKEMKINQENLYVYPIDGEIKKVCPQETVTFLVFSSGRIVTVVWKAMS